MGGDLSYTELLTCLEMARDVRAMRAQQGGAMDPEAAGESNARNQNIAGTSCVPRADVGPAR